MEFWEIPGRTPQKHKDFQKTRRACIHGKMGLKMQYQRPGGREDCFQTKGPLFIPIGNDKQTVVDTRLPPGESAKTKDPICRWMRCQVSLLPVPIAILLLFKLSLLFYHCYQGNYDECPFPGQAVLRQELHKGSQAQRRLFLLMILSFSIRQRLECDKTWRLCPWRRATAQPASLVVCGFPLHYLAVWQKSARRMDLKGSKGRRV